MSDEAIKKSRSKKINTFCLTFEPRLAVSNRIFFIDNRKVHAGFTCRLFS